MNNMQFDPMTGQPINKKSNNKVLIIIISLILLGIIGGLIYFNSQNNSELATNDTNNVIDSNEENDNTTENDSSENNEDNSDSSSNLTEQEYNGTKENINIATIGQVDHGKSTLTSAITKFYGNYITADTISSAPEVKKNGVTYYASFIEYETDNRHYSHYDLSNHSDYVRALLSGSIKLDGAILVVAATDGIMPQTREQLKLIKDTGVSKVVVYMSKCDMVDDYELLELVEEEIRVLLEEFGFDRNNTPIIKGSALKAIEGDYDEEQNIRNLISSMDTWISKNENHEISYPHTKFMANIYMLTKEEGGRHTPIFNGYASQFAFSYKEETGTIAMPEGLEMVMPGDNYEATVTLTNSNSFKKGDYFNIFEGDKLVGVGVVTEVIE